MTQPPHTLASVLPVSKPKRKPWTLIAVAAVVVVLAAGAGAYLLWPRDLTITGTVVLTGKLDASGTTCGGAGGYADIREGAPVLVTDSAGVNIGISKLGTSKWVAAEECRLPFSVDAPAGKDIYGLTIGNRKGLTYAEADLTAPLTLTIGK